ncbi:uncharacterized protein LOC136084944 [Hydra vulgaris]|uniref:Uncharacterized protein LOC136084944 n=1 Tax=Hydra vulgaris TaxID=6087 RepID=A0ABM4CKW9_HYDVU
MSKVKTRSSTTAISDFIGPGKDFIPSELPTNRAVTEKQDIELYEEYQKNISPDISLNDNYNPVNVNFTLKQDNEIKLLIERLLKDKLGVYAFLVTRFLKKKSRKNTMSIKNTAMASIRFGISPAATAAIATSYLQDLIEAGFLTPEYSYLACDPS